MVETLPPFVEIEGNPRPEGLVGGSLVLRDGKRIRYALVRPEGTPLGTVLVLPGRNEAIEKYFETIRDLLRRDHAVAIFDWRGQGGSERLLKDHSRGHVNRIGTFVRDLEEFVDAVLVPRCPAPYVVLAHSLGGLVALAAAPRLVGRIERMVLSAPFVALRNARPGRGLLPAATRLLRSVGLGRLPIRRVRRDLNRDVRQDILTSDPVRFERNRRLATDHPDLFVATLTASWLDACFREMRRLDDSDVIARLHLPTLVVTAGADRVVNSAVAERLAWRMRSGHAISISGARHELLQERDEHRELFLAAFDGFVGSVMTAAPEPEPEPIPGAISQSELGDLERALAS